MTREDTRIDGCVWELPFVDRRYEQFDQVDPQVGMTIPFAFGVLLNSCHVATSMGGDTITQKVDHASTARSQVVCADSPRRRRR